MSLKTVKYLGSLLASASMVANPLAAQAGGMGHFANMNRGGMVAGVNCRPGSQPARMGQAGFGGNKPLNVYTGNTIDASKNSSVNNRNIDASKNSSVRNRNIDASKNTSVNNRNIDASKNTSVYNHNIDASKNTSINKPVTITNNIDASKNVSVYKPVTITKNIDNSKYIDASKNVSITKNINIEKNNTYNYGGHGGHGGGGSNSNSNSSSSSAAEAAAIAAAVAAAFANANSNSSSNAVVNFNGGSNYGGNAYANASANAGSESYASAFGYSGAGTISGSSAISESFGGGGGGGGGGDIGTIAVEAPAPVAVAAAPVACTFQETTVIKAIHATCVSADSHEFPASHMVGDTWLEASYEGEVARCLPGSHLKVMVGAVFQSSEGMASNWTNGQTLECGAHEALRHFRGGMLKCAVAVAVPDCTERTNLRKFGTGDIFFTYRTKVCMETHQEYVANESHEVIREEERHGYSSSRSSSY